MEEILSNSECNLILTKYFGSEKFELINYNVAPLSNQVEGFLGEHYIVKAEVKVNNISSTVSFFAKIPPVKHDLQMEYTRTSNSFEKETFFYEKMVEEFKLYCPSFDTRILPKYYYSRENNLIILENLQETNFCVAPFQDTLDEKHIRLILRTLSKFHSASIIYEEKKSVELGKPFRLINDHSEFLTEAFFRSDCSYLGHKWHTASLKGILAVIDKMSEIDVSNNEFKEKFIRLTEKCFEIVKPNKFRNVICHGDLWRKNILFRYENDIPAECKLIDFQLMKYNPPAFDVLKIIYQTTTSEMRRHHYENFLKYYYDNLCKELTLGDVDVTQVLPRDQFYDSIKHMLPQCKVETSYYFSYQKFGPEFLKSLMENLEDFREFSFIDRTAFMVEYYKVGSVYKRWMDEILLDIKDMLFNYYFTREDCYAVLHRKLNTTDFKLLKYSLERTEEKNGFLGEHFTIRMDINYNNTIMCHRFFTKILPDSGFSSFIVTSGAFNNEKFMFDHVFQKMSIFGIKDIYDCVPKCFLSRYNNILVLEDLNQLGFKVADKYKPLNMNEMSIVLKSLAKYHGSVLLLEEEISKRSGKKFRVEDQYNNDLREICYVKTKGHMGVDAIIAAIKGIYAMIDLFPDSESSITDSEFKQLVKRLYKKTMYKLAGPSTRYRNVICHGDLWASNIMLKYEHGIPVESKLIDFQCVKICPPAHDLMALIYLTTSRKFRANFMSDLILLYYEELKQILKKYNYDVKTIIPQEDFLLSCEEYKIFAITQATTHFPIIMINQEEMENFFNDKDLCYRTMFVDRTEFINSMVEKDEKYTIMLKECMKDFRFLCENLKDQCDNYEKD